MLLCLWLLRCGRITGGERCCAGGSLTPGGGGQWAIKAEHAVVKKRGDDEFSSGRR